MLELLRVMFPYMALVCLAAVFMGVLNARGHFFIPALGATLLNVVMIASVFLGAPKFGTRLDEQIFALAFGVLVAGVAQAAFQLPSLRREGWRLAFAPDCGHGQRAAKIGDLDSGAQLVHGEAPRQSLRLIGGAIEQQAVSIGRDKKIKQNFALRRQQSGETGLVRSGLHA